MERIILFYKFYPIADPAVMKLWQLELCRRLNLTGRVIVSPAGLNGTLGGRLADLKAYRRSLKSWPPGRDIDYKWSAGCRDDFPKLSVKVRPEPVTLQTNQDFAAWRAPVGLTPQQWHQYLEKHPDVLVLDARNDYESSIGCFRVKNLIKPAIKTFKEIKGVVAQLPKDQPILTYCTGDIRCEYLSAYMHTQGFAQVHHLRGGIIKYGQAYRDRGFWQGKCYVFDKRMKLSFSDESQDIARCLNCRQATSEQVNCDDCNRQLVVCLKCQRQPFYHCQQPTVSRA